ncbi:MAG: PKD repeat protein [Bacteroidia bacterium]|jgi:PKD repeat protein
MEQYSRFDSIIWDFGDGYKSYMWYPKHTYTTPGQYDIKLSLKGFCGEDENSLKVDIVTADGGKPQVGLNAYPNVGLPYGNTKHQYMAGKLGARRP